MPNPTPLLRNGRVLPTYDFTDRETGSDAVAFVDKQMIPRRDDPIIVSDGKRCWNARYTPEAPLPFGHCLVGRLVAALVIVE